MNYTEALKYISSVNWKGSVPGLERITELMHKLGDPQKHLKFVHIGGTNGKGSTAAFISNILRAAGYQTGLFISPYIEVFNERMQINNRNITDEELAEITSYIRPFADSMQDVPTEFELNTAIALEYFSRNHCDIVVFEVGMGGEFDATNVIDCPEVAVLTAIGLDHMAYLGDTVEKIAATKAGIIKPGCQVVLYDQQYAMKDTEAEAVTRIFEDRCHEVGAQLHAAEPAKLELVHRDITGQIFQSEFGSLSIPMAAAYQKYNLATALKAIEVLISLGYRISPEQIRAGLSEARWPGRFEILRTNPVFLADGAHNPQGIGAAAESLKAVFPEQKMIMIFGVLADKDYENMLDTILPLTKQMLCVTPDNSRALAAADLARLVNKRNIPAKECASIPDAIREALETADPQDVICALGSLYMIGDIKNALKHVTT